MFFFLRFSRSHLILRSFHCLMVLNSNSQGISPLLIKGNGLKFNEGKNFLVVEKSINCMNDIGSELHVTKNEADILAFV